MVSTGLAVPSPALRNGGEEGPTVAGLRSTVGNGGDDRAKAVPIAYWRCDGEDAVWLVVVRSLCN